MRTINISIPIIIFLFACGNLNAQETGRITILHTNDTHSRIEPMPAKDKNYPGMGGYQLRANLIKSYREKDPGLILMDAGDFSQGTPYFNLFKGEIEIELMNALKYDVVTLGNHEFDNGLESMKNILGKASFPVVCCNLDFSETSLKDLIQPYIIMENIKGLKIGIIGATVNPVGLVALENYQGIKVLPCIETINHYAAFLRDEADCDLVICLSHLGFDQEREGEPYDQLLAQESENIDIIIGGHSHTFLEEPVYIENKTGKKVLINQEGKNGIFVGKIEVDFKKE